jgi:hypothetical protein
LFLIKHSMKKYGGVEVLLPAFLIPALCGCEWSRRRAVSCTPRPPYPWGNSPPLSIIFLSSDPQSQPGHCGLQKFPFPSQESNPGSLNVLTAAWSLYRLTYPGSKQLSAEYIKITCEINARDFYSSRSYLMEEITSRLIHTHFHVKFNTLFLKKIMVIQNHLHTQSISNCSPFLWAEWVGSQSEGIGGRTEPNSFDLNFLRFLLLSEDMSSVLQCEMENENVWDIFL